MHFMNRVKVVLFMPKFIKVWYPSEQNVELKFQFPINEVDY